MSRHLIGVITLAVASTLIAFSLPITQSPIWTLFALVYFSVVPGYALLSALFPVSSQELTSDYQSAREALGQWIALSVGLSIILVPLVGLSLVALGSGLRAEYIVSVLNGLIILSSLISLVRARLSGYPTSPDVKQTPRLHDYANPFQAVLSGRRIDVFLNIVVVLCVCLFIGSVSYAAVSPSPNHEYTQFYLPGQAETVEAAEYAQYPSEVVYDEQNTATVAVTNREGEEVKYTIVVEIQTTVEENGSAQVISSKELERADITVKHNETATRDMELVLSQTGENLRLVFLLYRGEAPPRTDIETAYKEVHLWVNSSR